MSPVDTQKHCLMPSQQYTDTPQVGVIMGSQSDWETMQNAVSILEQFAVAHEVRVVSAHRTPDLMSEYARSAAERGLQVIIAGAGGAAHLPGMVAAMTRLPVLGVPVKSRALNGLDSLLSIVQMPAGVPVATMSIGNSGASNAGLQAVSILALQDPALAERLEGFRLQQTASISNWGDPRTHD
jgi:5-(carboxyamino)imidazole ribonucleotide mutase